MTLGNSPALLCWPKGKIPQKLSPPELWGTGPISVNFSNPSFGILLESHLSQLTFLSLNTFRCCVKEVFSPTWIEQQLRAATLNTAGLGKVFACWATARYFNSFHGKGSWSGETIPQTGFESHGLLKHTVWSHVHVSIGTNNKRRSGEKKKKDNL